MESEFIVLELAGQEAEWLRNLLADMPLWGRQASPVSLHCDSQAVLGIDKNRVYNNNKKHIFASDMVHLNSSLNWVLFPWNMQGPKEIWRIL